MNRSISVALVTASLVTVASLAGACGGQTSQTLPTTAPADAGSTTVVGAIDGIGIPTAYALAIPDNSGGGFGSQNIETTLAIGIADKPLACDTPGLPKSTFIGITINTGGVTGVGPGTYAIDADPSSSVNNVAALITTDATCRATSPSGCIGGSITITSVTKTELVGSFTLAFESGEALTGTFAAPVCKSIPAALNGSTC